MRNDKGIKIGYINRGHNRSDPVWIEIEERDDGFSLHGHIRYGEWGQVDMSIWPAIKEGKFEFLLPEEDVMHVLRFWRDWHLNGMHAGCIHQREVLDDMDKRIKAIELFEHVRQRKDEKPFEIETSYVFKRDYLKGIGLHHCAICNFVYGTGWRTELPPAKELAWIRKFKAKWEGVEIGRRLHRRR
jgi:hypothetical protein